MTDAAPTLHDYLTETIQLAREKGYRVESIDARGYVVLGLPKTEQTIEIRGLFPNAVIRDCLKDISEVAA